MRSEEFTDPQRGHSGFGGSKKKAASLVNSSMNRVHQKYIKYNEVVDVLCVDIKIECSKIE